MLVGVIALVALSGLVLAVAEASATGLTAVRCGEVKAGTGSYSSSKCETPKAEGGSFETVQLSPNEATEVEGEAIGSTVLTFGATKFGYTITCSKGHLGGRLTNIEEGGEMKVHGTGIVLEFSGCQASLVVNPAKKCEIESVTGGSKKGSLITAPLTAISGAEHGITFQPEEGSTFASFKVLQGECMPDTMALEVTGSVIGVANTTTHSHITFEPATNGSGLQIAGGSGSIESTTALTMKGTETRVGFETF
jgi:hypothetical protein